MEWQSLQLPTPGRRGPLCEPPLPGRVDRDRAYETGDRVLHTAYRVPGSGAGSEYRFIEAAGSASQPFRHQQCTVPFVMKTATPDEVDLPVEQRKILWRSAGAFVFCIAVLGGAYIILPAYFRFPVGLPERLAFVLQADLFVFLWIVLGIRMVAKGRFHSAADNRGSAYAPPSPKLAVRVAFLQNTLEQAVTAIGAHLALATLLSGPVLALIPAAVVLFAVGRVTFLLGYPKGAGGRAFGIATTAIPTVGGYALAIVLIVSRLWPTSDL